MYVLNFKKNIFANIAGFTMQSYLKETIDIPYYSLWLSCNLLKWIPVDFFILMVFIFC